MMILKVGTRSSALALKQTDIVLDNLKEKYPDAEFDIRHIKTKGDSDKSLPLYTMKNKGLFSTELNVAVEREEIDFAVHSMKDLSYLLPKNLTISCILKREKPNDVLISKNKKKLVELKEGGIIGTSSLRRAIQISKMRPDLCVKPIRGNVETRIKKVLDGNFDAIVLAEAGIKRLGISYYISERLSMTNFVPAPCQGAIAIISRKNDERIVKILSVIDDFKTREEVTIERNVINSLGGGCKFPIGIIAKIRKDEIT